MISVFDMFTIGIGPSSSHTVGPMRAARLFVQRLKSDGLLEKTASVKAELFGSLGHTGKGHGSDKAIILGLLGETPESVDVDRIPELLENMAKTGQLTLLREKSIAFDLREHLIFNRKTSLPFHPNGMCFKACDNSHAEIASREYYSVGGGFVLNQNQAHDQALPLQSACPHPFNTSEELLAVGRETNLTIADIMWKNETSVRDEKSLRAKLHSIWQAMDNCIKRGCESEGILPGGLKVKRRAPQLSQMLVKDEGPVDPLKVMDWISLYAIAVNEENAAGGRVVTAPTNGAAGIIPAVLKYYSRFSPGANDEGILNFLMTAAAIGILYKENASISGADVGCQGEVGVACSMAAAGLTQAMGGTNEQIENAAEVGMEHNLGLTCDPVGGLVQIPCIERNSMGAIKAINASRLALLGDGQHHVSLDKVIKTMRQTGADMQTKYKETSRGGLAVNVIEC